jgi:nitrogen fixation/metabolism regulation signal transduction histidine kinase
LIYWLTGGELLAQAKMAHASLEDPLAHLAFAILLGNVVAMLVSGAATIFVMLYASHKIGGPLYRFEKLCQQVGGGRLDAAPELRAGDQLQDLGKAFQDMVASLRNRQEHRVVSAMKLSSVLDQLQKDPDFVDRHLDKLEQMRQTLTQLQE